MRLKTALLYIALAGVANTGWADTAALEALREGDMKKLAFHGEPIAAPDDVTFEANGGGDGQLADYEGKVLLLNFWATWCLPCREEMPELAALQEEFGGEDFEVVTVATGRNPPDAMARFFDEIGVDNLPLHRDPRQGFARSMGVLGLPVTVLIDAEGREIGRLQGGADWGSDSARAIVEALLEDRETAAAE
ncbi:thiol:disulfide interchange protein, putative [Oceanicola granulosus HTCC2516]|uniref:Thiol:disulfide interchange protein, putative n=1 Tax=Oceanicola granulosus (strain ATCC BAA-861 / DSM 15982 / KCTC 12143 / HTCC2516) TaxID=314256 RepID=Q2CDQ6_OCEGH|nr:TlpA disulfide reductase family protein [Oceanicola granulosus]EAR50794.1 thiol:disulfide interchange protein, putative [Oceanicola granulosus HTCC2516]